LLLPNGIFQLFIQVDNTNYGLTTTSTVPAPLAAFSFIQHARTSTTAPVVAQHFDRMTGNNTNDICFDVSGDGIVPVWVNGTYIDPSQVKSKFYPSYTTPMTGNAQYSYTAGVYTGNTANFVTYGTLDLAFQTGIWPLIDASYNSVPYTQFVADFANEHNNPTPNSITSYDPRLLSFISGTPTTSLLKRNSLDESESQVLSNNVKSRDPQDIPNLEVSQVPKIESSKGDYLVSQEPKIESSKGDTYLHSQALVLLVLIGLLVIGFVTFLLVLFLKA